MTFGILLLVVYLYQSHALYCYRGKYWLYTNQTARFEEFYQVQCQPRQSCARWSTEHPESTSFHFGCSKRCRGMSCCRDEDMCNSQWIQEYRNRTTERVVIDLLPDKPWKEDQHKIYPQKPKIVKMDPIPVWKSDRLDPMNAPERSHRMIFVILVGLAGVSLLAIGGAIFIFCIADSTSTPVVV